MTNSFWSTDFKVRIHKEYSYCALNSQFLISCVRKLAVPGFRFSDTAFITT